MSFYENSNLLPALDIALPLYTTAHIEKLEACCLAVADDCVCPGIIDGKSERWVKTAAQEAMRAEKLLNDFMFCDREEKLLFNLDGLDDFSLAAISWNMFETSSVLDETGERLGKASHEILLNVLKSPEGSILVDYDWMFADVAEASLFTGNADPISILVAGLAHNLKYDNGKQVIKILRQMAAAHLEKDQLKQAVDIYTMLIKNNPHDFDTYENAAATFSSHGYGTTARSLVDLCIELAQGCPWTEHTAEDLAVLVGLGEKKSVAQPEIFKPLIEAMKLYPKKGEGRRARQLALEVVPNIDQIPVKRMPQAFEPISDPIKEPDFGEYNFKKPVAVNQKPKKKTYELKKKRKQKKKSRIKNRK